MGLRPQLRNSEPKRVNYRVDRGAGAGATHKARLEMACVGMNNNPSWILTSQGPRKSEVAHEPAARTETMKM
jgi:hypothetical protein